MTREFYEGLNERVRRMRHASGLLMILSGGATAIVAALYIFTLFLFFVSRDYMIIMITCPPAAGFIFLSMVRNGINRKRPYEKYDIIPLIEKDTKGHSFPSRHVFSAFAIGAIFVPVSPKLAVICLAAGTVIALCRVLSGVHFIIDVVFGAAFGTAFSLVFDIIYFMNH